MLNENPIKSHTIKIPLRYKQNAKKINQIAHKAYIEAKLTKEILNELDKDSENSHMKISLSYITKEYFKDIQKDIQNLTLREFVICSFYIAEKLNWNFICEDERFFTDQLKMFNKK